MAIELFWTSGSPFAWRVQLALALKGIAYESRRLHFDKGDNRTPEFLAVSPRGRVPALRDGDVTVWESVACLAYLDRAHPEPPLFGATPAEAARIWPLVAACVADFDGPADAIISPLYFGFGGPGLAANPAALAEPLELVAREIARVEASLAGGPWQGGLARPTAADCTIYPIVRSLLRAASKPAAAELRFSFLPLAQHHPALAAWMARVEALPGYDATFPPHWRGTPG